MLKQFRKSDFRIGLAIFLMLTVSIGCEPDFVAGELTTDVTGQVLLDGQPVAGAKVVFIPFRLNGPNGDKQTMAYGTTDAEGNFILRRANDQPGVWRGLHRVIISKKDSEGARMGRLESADLARFDDTKFKLSQPADEKIPVIYNLQSTLTFNVDSTLKMVRANFELNSVDPLLKQ